MILYDYNVQKSTVIRKKCVKSLTFTQIYNNIKACGYGRPPEPGSYSASSLSALHTPKQIEGSGLSQRRRMGLFLYRRLIMADTRARIFVTSEAWTNIVSGPITSGIISPETQSIRAAISTGAAPTDLTQGHLVYSHGRMAFSLDAGETLYIVAVGNDTSLITTY